MDSMAKGSGSVEDERSAKANAVREAAWVRAIESDDEERISAMLGAGWDPDWRTPLGVPSLALAIKEGSKRVFQALIDGGADVDVRDRVGVPLVLRVAEAGVAHGSDWLRMVVEAGCGLDVQDDREGWTALHLAVTRGAQERVGMVLRAGADMERRDAFGRTPALLAVEMGRGECLAMLLRAGCDFDAVDTVGHSAMEMARSKGSGACEALLQSAIDERAVGQFAPRFDCPGRKLRI